MAGLIELPPLTKATPCIGDVRAHAASIRALKGNAMTAQQTAPTPEGLRRYEPDGYYREGGEPIPCVCKPECSYACKGECGCKACNAAFQDFGYE
jgi:hypothetical protein